MAKKSPPTSLLHYTSLEAFFSMIKDVYEGKSDNLNVHLSNIRMMNDLGEYNLIIDKFLTNSKSKQIIRNQIEQIILNKGDIFVYSLMYSDKFRMGKIPMWKMYADNCKGVKLRFNYKNLNSYLSNLSNGFDYKLKECKYFTFNEINKKVAEYNYCFKKNKCDSEDSEYINLLNSLLNEVSFIKYKYWEYESEYRIVVRSKSNKFKLTPRGLVKYHELPIPISLLEEVQIGPSANLVTTKESLETIKRALFKSTKFNISESKLLIN